MGLFCNLIFFLFGFFSYLIFRNKKFGRKLISNYLRELQKNDCQGYREDEIGMEKYFIRKCFVKKNRDENIRIFENAVTEPPVILNGNIINDDFGELGK